jgi:hypothetical protein
MSQGNTDIAQLETLLRLAKDRLAAAESGLFTPSSPLIDRYRTDVERLQRELHERKLEQAQAKRLAVPKSDKR